MGTPHVAGGSDEQPQPLRVLRCCCGSAMLPLRARASCLCGLAVAAGPDTGYCAVAGGTTSKRLQPVACWDGEVQRVEALGSLAPTPTPTTCCSLANHARSLCGMPWSYLDVRPRRMLWAVQPATSATASSGNRRARDSGEHPGRAHDTANACPLLHLGTYKSSAASWAARQNACPAGRRACTPRSFGRPSKLCISNNLDPWARRGVCMWEISLGGFSAVSSCRRPSRTLAHNFSPAGTGTPKDASG